MIVTDYLKTNVSRGKKGTNFSLSLTNLFTKNHMKCLNLLLYPTKKRYTKDIRHSNKILVVKAWFHLLVSRFDLMLPFCYYNDEYL